MVLEAAAVVSVANTVVGSSASVTETAKGKRVVFTIFLPELKLIVQNFVKFNRRQNKHI
ncbi:hypothetical protein BSPA111_29060 [Buttiauxella sp. A111]|nr:hypothetical protein BSPA111_29060 [Buttiauxella sp. A111]